MLRPNRQFVLIRWKPENPTAWIATWFKRHVSSERTGSPCIQLWCAKKKKKKCMRAHAQSLTVIMHTARAPGVCLCVCLWASVCVREKELNIFFLVASIRLPLEVSWRCHSDHLIPTSSPFYTPLLSISVTQAGRCASGWPDGVCYTCFAHHLTVIFIRHGAATGLLVLEGSTGRKPFVSELAPRNEWKRKNEK